MKLNKYVRMSSIHSFALRMTKHIDRAIVYVFMFITNGRFLNQTNATTKININISKE